MALDTTDAASAAVVATSICAVRSTSVAPSAGVTVAVVTAPASSTSRAAVWPAATVTLALPCNGVPTTWPVSVTSAARVATMKWPSAALTPMNSSEFVSTKPATGAPLADSVPATKPTPPLTL